MDYTKERYGYTPYKFKFTVTPRPGEKCESNYFSPVEKLTVGVLFRLGSFWVGAHYSKEKHRLCVNLLPCCTIWFAFKDGYKP